ncbi:hypothetical protein RUM43_009321 [Polyplax serrata]|uniref:UBC core domain-containing protein n=1 Tax=Polyplax serrata TaxID=468196 RepID=A0AAN8P814_POLSC
MDTGKARQNVGPSGGLHRTDSFRKVLPSKPSATVDSRLSMSMKMIERPVGNEGTNRGNKMFLPYFLEYAIMAEYLMLQKQELTGIYVIPSDVDPLVWFGVIFVRQGLYEGGIFRFQLLFHEDFPDGPCPKVIFESDVFHPAVNIETGELNVSDEFKEWKRNVNHVWQVLQYAGRIFYRIDLKSPANNVASELFTKDNEKFKKLVKLCVEESQAKINQKPTNEDPNYLHFEPYSESMHESVRQQMQKMQEE